MSASVSVRIAIGEAGNRGCSPAGKSSRRISLRRQLWWAATAPPRVWGYLAISGRAKQNECRKGSRSLDSGLRRSERWEEIETIGREREGTASGRLMGGELARMRKRTAGGTAAIEDGCV